MPYADPDVQRAAQREHARRKRASAADDGSGSRTEVGDVEPVVAPLVPSALQIEKAGDVLDLLARHVRAVDASKSADALMKARAVAQIAAPMLRAIEARDAATVRDIEGYVAKIDEWAMEVCRDLIAGVVRAVLDALPLTPEQRREAPDIVRRVVSEYRASHSEHVADPTPAPK